MATMQEIINAVLTEARFGSGTDVQIHLQGGLAAYISRLYRTLMKKHVWRDYHTISTLNTIAATGQVSEDITGILTKFTNIISVFLGNEDTPLPVGPIGMNPLRFRRPTLIPVSTTGKIFAIYPKLDREIVLISRNFSEDDFELGDEVPFYTDLLVLGAAADLLVKAGTNRDLAQTLSVEYRALLDTYLIGQMQNEYPLNIHRGTYPTEWHTQDG